MLHDATSVHPELRDIKYPRLYVIEMQAANQSSETSRELFSLAFGTGAFNRDTSLIGRSRAIEIICRNHESRRKRARASSRALDREHRFPLSCSPPTFIQSRRYASHLRRQFALVLSQCTDQVFRWTHT